MTDRLIIAYSLIALMVAAAAAVIWWNAYHSRRRVEARRRKHSDEYDGKRDEANARRALEGK